MQLDASFSSHRLCQVVSLACQHKQAFSTAICALHGRHGACCAVHAAVNWTGAGLPSLCSEDCSVAVLTSTPALLEAIIPLPCTRSVRTGKDVWS